MWDIHLAAWTQSAIAAGENTRQADYGTVFNLASQGLVTNLDGSPLSAAGFVVNCPAVSMNPTQ